MLVDALYTLGDSVALGMMLPSLISATHVWLSQLVSCRCSLVHPYGCSCTASVHSADILLH